MRNPHILAIPYPAQGHVIPLMELSKCLVNHGIKVTFVNTEYNHKRVMNAMEDTSDMLGQINLVSMPDGMEVWEDRNDLGKLCEANLSVMPGKLEELIRKINQVDGEKIVCVIADESCGWALEVAERLKIHRAAFWPAAAALLALGFSIPKLIHDGIIQDNGTPLRNQMIQLAPAMPTMRAEHLIWACIGDMTTQRIIFETMVRNNESVKTADWILCNSAHDLEPSAFTLAPEILPIGPLLAKTRLGISSGSFWAEDPSCLEWLDQQQPNSVIYVAFGSFTVFDQTQFNELALGLEFTNRPFIWVVRPDMRDNENSNTYPEGFRERTGSRGRMVGWAPQQRILGHPSVACFLTHCGWNSTVEGLSNGVPFLCWPYFADQFMNQSYICDVWKVGLKLERNGSGVIVKEEIKNKVEQVLGDGKFKERALELRELALNNVREGGKSNHIFQNFVEWVKMESWGQH